jgi:hypothetical protein
MEIKEQVNEILENIEKIDDLADHIDKIMREIEYGFSEEYDYNKEPYRRDRKGDERSSGVSPSGYNTYPGIPDKCKTIFLGIIPDYKKLKPHPIFYPKLLLNFFDWIEHCDNFTNRFVVVVSEREPKPFKPIHFRWWHWHWHWIEPKDCHYPSIYEFAIDTIVLYRELPSITRYAIYQFLKNDWEHKFSWYIKGKSGMTYFDGVKIK